jgi:hypothetical protein
VASDGGGVRGTSRYARIREYKGVHLELGKLASMGAHAVGIGRKESGGAAGETLSLRFYVSKKRPLHQLTSQETVPKRLPFFSRREGKELRITTDVVESSPAQLEQEALVPDQRVRPVPGGVNVGIPGTSGTLGGWVWDLLDDSIVFLSNEHVLGTTPGVEVLQQSGAHGGAAPDSRIGQVKRGIARSDTEPNRIDCAIGDPDAASLWDLDVVDVGPAVFATRAADLDLAVEKYGQKTRFTTGRITDSDWSGQVGSRSFEDCFRVDPEAPSGDWSGSGDSGSLVFSRDPIDPESEIKPAVGLHFAGAGSYGIACRIENVFTALDLTTLSAGAFSAFVEALFEAESAGEVSPETEGELRTVSALAARRPPLAAPLPFARLERRHARSGTFFAGIASDLRRRFEAGGEGRRLTAFYDRNQAELLGLISRQGDVRRSVAAAFRPLVAGATTTTDVLERILTDLDLAAFDRLGRELERLGSERLKAAIAPLRALRRKAAGKSLAEILGLEVA